MAARTGHTQDHIPYSYYACKCGEEILDMKQLHEVAERYRTLKTYRVKVSRWGGSVGIRLPRELAKHYHFKDEVTLLPEKDGVRILKA